MSSPRSTRKRVKKLVKDLLSLQRDDIPMTVSTLLETKYLLRNTKHCAHVEVGSDSSDEDLDRVVELVDRDSLPTFILCQLEDQKLTSPSSCRVALTRILSFVVSSLPYHFSKDHVFPTLFRWHCSRRHRTHVIFAYIRFPMKSRGYTLQELLGLRGSGSRGLAATMASKDPELADLVLGKKKSSSSIRRVRKSKDDSSTGSDEVLYRGMAQRRQLQALAQARSASQAAAKASAKTPALLPPQAPVQAPVDATVRPSASCQPPAQPSAHSEGEGEWRYRGRSGSDVAVAEPLPAPPGLNAQQNEGFQRFYKAVVSPTHVRVTAGGRIVPNTRGGATSPPTKRPSEGENASGSQTAQPAQPAHAAPQGAHAAQPAQSAQPAQAQPTQTAREGVSMTPMPAMPHFFPGFAPGMPPMGPFPMMPRPVSVSGVFPFPVPPMVVPAVPGRNPTPGRQTLRESHNKKAEAEQGRPASAAPKVNRSVNLSPPEQFDHTKPFMYNGQWMYPVAGPYPPPYGGWLMPPAMVPGPNFMSPHSPGHLMMPGHPMAMPPMVGNVGPQPSPTMAGFAMPRGPSPLVLQAPGAPPISSIRPSEVTTRQLDSLRASLKYHEDQLQFNRHQIDEKDMENKIKMLKHDIERFERMRQAHLDYEAAHYPKTDRETEEAAGESDSPRRLTGPEDNSGDAPAEASFTKDAPQKNGSSRLKAGIGSDRTSEASFESRPTRPFSRAVSVPVKTSSLPSCAALAPPFKPRTDSSFNDGQEGEDWGTLDFSKATKEQLGTSETRLLKASEGAFKSDSTYSTWDDVKANVQLQEKAPGAQGTEKDHGDLGVPYLIGTLPRGVNPRSAHSSDYVYSRQLTEDEIRARYLYWGNAPRSAQHGLPKFDGKNFYPPSPGRAATTPKDSRHVSRVAHFEPDTPSEAILAVKRLTSGKGVAAASPVASFGSQSGSGDEEAGSYDGRQKLKPFRASEGDARALEDHEHTERRSAGSRLLHSMLKRGFTSSDVLPSTISPTTAQGYLPHYSGHAAASLSPRVNEASTSRRTPSNKFNEYGLLEGTITPPSAMAERRGENRPPLGPASLEESFRNIVATETKQNIGIPPHWDA